MDSLGKKKSLLNETELERLDDIRALLALGYLCRFAQFFKFLNHSLGSYRASMLLICMPIKKLIKVNKGALILKLKTKINSRVSM